MVDPHVGVPEALEITAQPRLWYALRVKSNFERASAAILSGKGFETYLPLYRELRRWSDRANVTEVPLFPGYVFVPTCATVCGNSPTCTRKSSRIMPTR